VTPYLSSSDRRAERESAEERELLLTPPMRAPYAARCPWCRQPVARHGPWALALCEHRYESEIRRRSEDRSLVATAGRVT
jgi:hypothetical protein